MPASGASEVQYRTGIGRLYYGLYLMSRERLKARNKLKARQLKRNPHQHLITVLKLQESSLGQQLEDLRILRVEADYHVTPSKPPYASWPGNWARADQLARRLLPRVMKL